MNKFQVSNEERKLLRKSKVCDLIVFDYEGDQYVCNVLTENVPSVIKEMKNYAERMRGEYEIAMTGKYPSMSRAIHFIMGEVKRAGRIVQKLAEAEQVSCESTAKVS